MSSSPTNQAIILSSISGVDDDKIKLERLVSQAREFVLLYDHDGGGDGGTSGEEGEEKRSAREVVGVLEKLLDEC
ncbi:hypothetical protein NP233_g12915 [Leucocoprinus birnbaumii]|uniref:Uncharacterized protein n=1 Tax=Leucocoprinus birnbaumii TaxID=56174 RepID=A0AAD5YJ33_9AGAR|nr:hypothetical protein NP233_g12915 [Leucocoprinus birnbaumii]